MEDEDILIILKGILIIVVISFLFDWYQLREFKHCYDINFQSNYCQRYLKED